MQEAHMNSKKSTKYEIDPYYDTPEWRTLRYQTLKRDGGICQYCGIKAYQADHVIPRWKNGPDILSNLVACCATCNKTAGGSLFVSFEAKRAWVRQHRKLDPVPPGSPTPKPKRKQKVVPTVKRGNLRKKLAERNNPEHVQFERLLHKSQS
jgi:hypothetical protein